MALFRIFEIIITDDQSVPGSPNPHYSNYDRFEVFYDDVTDDFTVNLNGSPYTGPTDITIGEYSTHWYVGSGAPSNNHLISDYSFCDGTTLVSFRIPKFHPAPPFAEKITTSNHSSCQPAIVCDIKFEGTPAITHSTNLGEGNGQFTVNATSSNGVVKYALFDFDYASDGQTSGTFTGLIPGGYTVWAKDENRCMAKIDVKILYKPAQGLYRRMVWKDLFGFGTSRLLIFQRGYVGDVVDIDLGDVSPFILKKPVPSQGDINDKFTPIHPTNAEINLMSERRFEFLIFHTLDNQRFRCEYEIDEDSVTKNIWSGFIIPQVFTGEFVERPFHSKFTATDNLESLKDIDFVDASGNILRGNVKLIKIIAFCLQQTGLLLNIQSGINIFEVNHLQESDGSSDPLDQTFVDVTCYRDEDGTFSCHEVLEAILRPFGARLYQYDGKWIIEEIDKAIAPYSWREFDSAGDFVSNGTFDPIVEFKQSQVHQGVEFLSSNQIMEVVPAYGKITIRSLLNYIGSVVSGGFEKEDLLSADNDSEFNGWTLRHNGTSGTNFRRVDTFDVGGRTRSREIRGIGALGERSVGMFSFDPQAFSGNLRDAFIESSPRPFQYGPGDTIKFSFDFLSQFGIDFEFGIIRFVLKVGNQFLQPDSTWSLAENIFRIYPSIQGEFQSYKADFELPAVTDLTDTTVQVRLYFYANRFYDVGVPGGPSAIPDLKAVSTANIDPSIDFKSDVLFRIPDGTEEYRAFVELRDGQINLTVEEDWPSPNNPRDIIIPNDYDDVGPERNEKYWKILSILHETNSITNRARGTNTFMVDNVLLDFFPGGDPPPQNQEVIHEISKYINEFLEIELYHFDLPTNINNAKNIYNNYFKLSDGTPTTKWTRTGINEQLQIQQILMKVLVGNHSAPTFRIRGPLIHETRRIGMNNYLKLRKLGSSLTLSNTEFAADLSDWAGDASAAQFAWTADNGGSAEVTLSGAQGSEKFFQDIVHEGGFIEVTVNVQELDQFIGPFEGVREDNLVLLMYKNGSIIHTERIKTFQNSFNTQKDSDFTYIAFAPSSIDRIGFFFQEVRGVGDVTYRVGKFDPRGVNIDEVYQISDYTFDEYHNTYELELTQISKSYLSLGGIDDGGTGQSGDTGTQFSGAFSNAYGGSFDSTLN